MKFLHTFTKGGLLLAFLMLCSSLALAQRTVKGKVTDAESGEGLIGATVTVVGTTRGAVSDIDGNFSVEVPEGSTQIRFAYTGYAEEVVTLSASNVVDMALKPGTVLDEVTVIGYGSLKSKEVTSAVASVKAEDFNKGNVTNAAQLIQGKVAGVSISRAGSDPNGDFTIRLRGLSSISSGTSPLIVLDGIPGVDISLVDPNDIEAIDILKDGSAAAIYGTRASAGVILITTRKGAAGRTVADYNGFVAFDQVARRYKTLSAEDFVNYGGTDFTPNDGPGGTDTNWFEEITQTGVSQAHNLSMSGGLGKGNYRASFNFRNANGILRNTGFKNYNGSLNFSQKVLNERVTINGNLAITTRDFDYGFLDAFRYSIVNNPTAPVTSTDATFDRYNGYVEQDLFDYFNPVAIIEQNDNRARGQRLIGNFKVDYEILPDLVASVSLAQERFSFNYGEYYSKQSKWRGIGRNGLGIQGYNSNISNLLESTLNYKVDFGSNSNLRLLGGYSYQQFEYSGFRAEGGNILTNVLENNNLGAFLDYDKGLGDISSYRGENKLVAFFGRATVNIDDIYFLSAGLRREGSTRFGENNKWGLFPFASAGADIGKLLSMNQVDQLKLRVGYGVTGNQPNANGLSKLLFNPGASFYYNGNYVPSYSPVRNQNADLKWEEKKEFNVGLDYSLLGYKITGSLDFYNRKTEDLILEFTVPQPPNLANRTFLNIASFTNTGLEATVNFNDIWKKDKFSWSPGLVFTTYSITLDAIGAADTIAAASVGAPGQNDVFYTIYYAGAPLGQLWGPVRTGVNSDGSITYADLDGDGVTGGSEKELFNQDQQKIGDGVPDFELGFNNTFKFGNWDLNFFLRGVFGHDLANEYRVFYENLDPTAVTWNKIDTKYFDPNVTAQNRFDDTHVENASFVKLDNATLGYNFKLGSGSWFNKARIYVSGQNLFTITNYTGVDPEPRLGDTGASDNGGRFNTTLNPLAPGIDRRSTYFLARTVSVGVNFGF